MALLEILLSYFCRFSAILRGVFSPLLKIEPSLQITQSMVLMPQSVFGYASPWLGYHQMQSGGHLAESTLRIEGMHCGACIGRVTQALNSTEGVHVVEVRLGAARINTSGPELIVPAIAAVAKAGYSAHLEG